MSVKFNLINLILSKYDRRIYFIWLVFRLEFTLFLQLLPHFQQSAFRHNEMHLLNYVPIEGSMFIQHKVTRTTISVAFVPANNGSPMARSNSVTVLVE